MLGLDAGLKGVDVLALVLFDVGRHSLQDVVGRRRATACAALGAAGLRDHVGVLVHHLVFLDQAGNFTIRVKPKVQFGKLTYFSQ